MKIQVLLFGNFGYSNNKIDGQTMELRQMRELLEKYNVDRFKYYDISQVRRKPFKQLMLLRDLSTSEHVFYFAAQSNLKFVFPFLFFLSLLVRFKLHYFAVGGWLPEYLKKYPIHTKLLKKIPTVYVELESMVEKLVEMYNFNNAKWFPNFRIFSFEIPPNNHNDNRLKLVFMARINKHKGYPTIFRMLSDVKKEGLQDLVMVDFYGPIFEPERNDFERNLKRHENAKYLGILKPQDIYTTLSRYDVMIFPTVYPGEGLPGTIIDSFISGIPVIATNWRYNSELIKHDYNGLLFEPHDQKLFNLHLKTLIFDKTKLKFLKSKSYAERDRFGEKTVWEIIVRDINLKTN